MLYKLLLGLLLMTSFSCSVFQEVNEEILITVGGIIIDEEVYTPLINNRNLLENLDMNLLPDSEDIVYLDILVGLHNEIVEKMALEIEYDGSIIYEDYKLDILSINNQLEIMKEANFNSSYSSYIVVPDLVISLLKGYIRKYSRKVVARTFRNKIKYPIR